MGFPVRLLVLVGLIVAAVRPAPAQQARVRFEVTADSNTAPPQPLVRVVNLIQDPRWRDALQNSFPIRLRYRVEIWRVRRDWFDAQERSFEWEDLIEYDPLADQYSKTRFWGGEVRQLLQYPTLRELEEAVGLFQRVSITPRGPGEYYFSASVHIRTLTDEEMEELERFLRGEATPRDEAGRPGNPLSRAARRLLLGLGGLPRETLENRSATFRVGG